MKLSLDLRKEKMSKNRNKFDYMFKRELINRRALMFFNIFENISSANKAHLTVPDLCIGLYSNCIDPLKFLKTLNSNHVNELDIIISMAKWLEENHTVYWLLTCACVDELLEQGKIKYNKEGYLCLSKQGNNK